MEWYNILAAVALGVGLGLGRFRRKDKGKGEARGKLGIIAAIVLLISGLAGMLSPIGGWSANLGGWLSASVVIAALLVIAAASLIATGVVLDLKDGVPDRRTLLACIIAPQIAMIALGASFGAEIHQDMVDRANLTKDSIATAQDH